MSLIDSLLSAIVRLDGDALVMHVGEKPYVVTSRTAMNEFRGPLVWGQVELSSKLLTLDAVGAMVDQLLPAGERQALQEIGAVEHELPNRENGSRFVVIAARGGQDIWLEIRHVRPTAAAADAVETSPPVAEEPAPAPVAEAPQSVEEPRAIAEAQPPAPVAVEEPAPAAVVEEPVEEPAPPAVEEPAPVAIVEEPAPVAVVEEPAPVAVVEEPAPVAVEEPAPVAVEEPAPAPFAVEEPVPQPVEAVSPLGGPALSPVVELATFAVEEQQQPEAVVPPPRALVEVPAEPAYQLVSPTPADLQPELVAEEPQRAPTAAVLESEGQLTFGHVAPVEETRVLPAEPPPTSYQVAEDELDEGSGAVVVPIARVPRDSAPPPQVVAPSDLDRLLRIAAARGASALYAVARTKPVVRVDGEMQTLDGEELLTPDTVEAFTMSVAQEPTREAVRAGETTEWICDMAEVGRVRCLSFFDHRGPGVIFRMLPPRAISAEQLGLSKEVQALSAVPDGLVLVAGPRGSDLSTLVAAFVDLVNRTRSEHVVTIETQILFLHEPKRSFVSQREVRGQGDEIAAAVWAAMREDPDVLVIEELGSAETVAAAVEAAQGGRLVFAGLRAPAAGPAIERLIEQTPAERRTQLRSAIASTLRGVVAQAMLRKRGGGRVAARELLLNTPAVASLIAEGKLFQIQAALQSGRKLGMTPLNDALASLVRGGLVDPTEAYRHAVERDALVAQLRRDGLDTSFVERLA
jgi:twitching motility protein PilT